MKTHIACQILKWADDADLAYEVEVTLKSGNSIIGTVGQVRKDFDLLPLYIVPFGASERLAEPLWIDVAEIAAIRIIDLG